MTRRPIARGQRTARTCPELEVVAKTLSLDLGPLSLGMASDVLDDASADKLRAIEGVRGVLAAADQRRTR